MTTCNYNLLYFNFIPGARKSIAECFRQNYLRICCSNYFALVGSHIVDTFNRDHISDPVCHFLLIFDTISQFTAYWWSIWKFWNEVIKLQETPKYIQFKNYKGRFLFWNTWIPKICFTYHNSINICQILISLFQNIL